MLDATLVALHTILALGRGSDIRCTRIFEQRQDSSKITVYMPSLTLRRFFIGTLPAGCDTPPPKPLSVKSSRTSLPSSTISQSNRLTIKAIVSNI
ncbi:hypothetical protein EV127DRAFT_247122 [Xylaria flabelliformis]|nr:hypothetical protein EV127DRAFT_247122 [Xylaria flabelliformis]